MDGVQIIWDLEDDPEGNYWHICVEGHDVTREEVDEILRNRRLKVVISRSSGRPMKIGWTSTGKHIAVVYEEVSEDPRIVCPITAYPVDPPARRKS